MSAIEFLKCIGQAINFVTTGIANELRCTDTIAGADGILLDIKGRETQMRHVCHIIWWLCCCSGEKQIEIRSN